MKHVGDMTTEILEAIWGQTDTTREETEIQEAVAEWLKSRSDYIVTTDADLRDVALEKTDLVEPEAA